MILFSFELEVNDSISLTKAVRYSSAVVRVVVFRGFPRDSQIQTQGSSLATVSLTVVLKVHLSIVVAFRSEVTEVTTYCRDNNLKPTLYFIFIFCVFYVVISK